ncbi:protoglobin domain-containing protein [Thalassobaculum salexigens]|uniref:protoglobin domain-containing protein n=1 Tax=Thalassobaculum salexigens TaxID=455360 RepID=UPI00146EB0D8|nr:protoglobin domain-containing protein [Thalassobaculum salexigens]
MPSPSDMDRSGSPPRRRPFDTGLHQLVTDRIFENVQSRLRLEAIDDYTRERLKIFQPKIADEMSAILSDFYRHMMQFPQTRKYLQNSDINALKSRQIQHWERLFSAEFDRPYIASAARIGLVHHAIGLPLHLYLSGYNRVLCDLTTLAIRHHSGSLSASDTVNAIIKVVSLDMDIAISCYFLAEILRLKPEEQNLGLV